MTTLHVSDAYDRRLLVGVFSPSEAQEALIGGARIIDSEHPTASLGCVTPRHIMDIRDAVVSFPRQSGIQLSTNIGDNQTLYRRTSSGHAIAKTRYEIAGKAAQAALGVAATMGTSVNPASYIKVGVDGMAFDEISAVLGEIVHALRRTEGLKHYQVTCVLFAHDLDLWNLRKNKDVFRKALVELGHICPCEPGHPDAFDITPYVVGTVSGRDGGTALFDSAAKVSLIKLIEHQVLPIWANSLFVRTSEPYSTGSTGERSVRTNLTSIKTIVDIAADAGANVVMIDTSILMKVTNACLVDTRHDDMIDINSLISNEGTIQQGILSLGDLQDFVDYCHRKGLKASLAGSIESYQAQQLWVLIPELDQIAARGAASALSRETYSNNIFRADARHRREIKRTLVRGLAPPEAGGILNVPDSLKDIPAALDRIHQLVAFLRRHKKLEYPELEAFWVNAFGEHAPFER